VMLRRDELATALRHPQAPKVISGGRSSGDMCSAMSVDVAAFRGQQNTTVASVHS